jgi:hypothetical protein
MFENSAVACFALRGRGRGRKEKCRANSLTNRASSRWCIPWRLWHERIFHLSTQPAGALRCTRPTWQVFSQLWFFTIKQTTSELLTFLFTACCHFSCCMQSLRPWALRVSLGDASGMSVRIVSVKNKPSEGPGLDQNPIIDGAVPFPFSPRKGKITFFLLHRRRTDRLFSSFALLSCVYILSERAAFRGFAHLNGRATSARRVAPHEYLENIWAL